MLLEFSSKKVSKVLANYLGKVMSLLSVRRFIVLILFVPLIDLIFF